MLSILQALLSLLLLPMSATSAWTAQWIDLSSSTTKILPPRSGHLSFTRGDDLYVFAGYAEEPDLTRYPINDLWKWQPTGWIQVAERGSSMPQERLAGAAATLGNTPLIIGGWDSQVAGTGGVILQDIVQLEKGGFKTLQLQLEQPTSRHVAVTIDESTVLIHTHRCSDHVLLLKAQTSGEEPTLHKQTVTGQAPSARGLHTAAKLMGSNHLVVFGGAAQDGNMSNEVFLLNLDTWKWTSVEIISKESPSRRASPCFCAVDDQCLVMFGGAERTPEGGLRGCDDLWLLEVEKDYETASWKRLETSIIPPGRNAATLNPIDPPIGQESDSKYYLLSGGWAPFKETYNDNFVLKMSK